MLQLDAVYKTFVNLEKNHKRSSKSVKEYITDKLGGDIEIGSTVILNYFSAQNFETEEDIEKLSTIRNIFSLIRQNIDKLDSMDSLNFEQTDNSISSIQALLDNAYVSGSSIELASGSNIDGARCYKVTAESIRFIPFSTLQKVPVYDENMRILLQQMMPSSTVKVGQVYVQETGGYLSLET